MEKGKFLSRQIEKTRLSRWPGLISVTKMTVENYLLFIALQCLPNNICTFLEL